MTKDTIKFIIDSALTGRRDRAFLSRESLQNTRCGKEDERTFMNFLNKMERKFGRYAIHNLSTYIIGAYVIGYFLYFLAPGVLYNYLSLEPYYILKGQIWRLVTWVLIPPESPGIFTIIMLMLYYSLGNSLEQTWGAFRYNAYIFSGIISTIIGAFILYAVMGGNIVFGQALFSTYYINMSIFLAFAVCYPNMELLLYFIIPIKVKWFGILYGAFIVLSFLQTNWAGRVAIIASMFNFILFFLMTRNYNKVSPKEIRRKQNFKRQTSQTGRSGITKHKCAAEPSWTVMIWNSVSVPNATEIMNIARIICLRTNISKNKNVVRPQSGSRRNNEENKDYLYNGTKNDGQDHSQRTDRRRNERGTFQFFSWKLRRTC